MRSAITGYSPHYLMFVNQPHLPFDFYFPTIRGMKKTSMLTWHIAKLCEQLQKAFKEVQVQSTSEAERQKWYYDRKANVISLEPGDLVLAKAHCLQGEEESEGLVGGGTVWSGEKRWCGQSWRHGGMKASLPTSWKTGRWDAHESSTKTDFFSPHLTKGTPSVQLCRLSGQGVPLPPWRSKLWKRVRTEEVPQSVHYLLLAGWVNRKLCTFLQMFLEASLLDQGVKSLMYRD